jgi:beta-apo-4'-carotenal oxygenase
MTTIDDAAYLHTPVEEIPTRVATVRSSFFEHKTRDIDFRLVQLRRLFWA